jgi:hypothetical protein
MSMANTPTYEDLKSELKSEFNALLNDQTLSENDLKQINELNPIQKKMMWSAFKSSAKLKIQEINRDKMADTINTDLQDAKININKQSHIKDMLAHPEKPEYSLDQTSIDLIKSLGDGEKKELAKMLCEKHNIAVSNTKLQEIGGKITDFLETVVDKLSPILENLFDFFVVWGAKKVSEIIDKKVEGELGDHLAKVVLDVGNAVISSTEESATVEVKVAGHDDLPHDVA